MLRGFGGESARQEGLRQQQDSRDRELAIDFWSSILSRGDLTPEGRQFVVKNISETMGAKPTRGFGGIRRGGKKNQFDIGQLVGQVMDMDQPTLDQGPKGTVSGQMETPFGSMHVEGPAAPVKKSRIFSDPEDLFRQQSELEHQYRMKELRGQSQVRSEADEAERQRSLAAIDKLDLDPATKERAKAMVVTGLSLPSEGRQRYGKPTEDYAGRLEFYMDVMQMPEDQAHAQALEDIEADKKAAAEKADLTQSLAQALLTNREGAPERARQRQLDSMVERAKRYAYSQAIKAQQAEIDNPQNYGLSDDEKRSKAMAVFNEAYQAALAELLPAEELDTLRGDIGQMPE